MGAFRSVRSMISAAILVFATGHSSVPGQDLFQKQAEASIATGDSTPDSRNQYTPVELLPVEQLVLMLNKAAVQPDNESQKLVFLGRTQQRGWEAIGNTNPEEIRSHWRLVASRVLASYTKKVGFEKREKIDLAVEISITQFLRTYAELREEFLNQPDQKSRIELVTTDDRYERLRQLGRAGIFGTDSLVGKVIESVSPE